MNKLVAVCLVGMSLQSFAAEPHALGFPSEKYWNKSQNIVMGGFENTANDKSSSYTVRLTMMDSSGKIIGRCTGIIISDNLILTAGHCLKQKDMSVNVEFGLGGKHGFHTVIKSTSYISSQAEDPQTGPPSAGPDLFDNGYLNFDQATAETYNAHYASGKYIEMGSLGFQYPLFFDLAVIKIDKIPTGYSPIGFYKGDINFDDKVYAAGYGMNDRTVAKNQGNLHWGRANVKGHYTTTSTAAVMTYSAAGQETCFGDSGGPIVMYVKGEPKLLGVNSASLNHCKSGALVTLPTHYQKFLKEAFEILGTSVEI